MEMIFQPGDAIVSNFGGEKVVCIGVVNSTMEFITLNSIEAFLISYF
jgi:transcription elongation factor